MQDHAKGCGGRNYTCTCGYDDEITAIRKRCADLEAALKKIAGFTSRCEHDGGFDRETGPIGCMLGDMCVCIGIHPVARDAVGGSYAD